MDRVYGCEHAIGAPTAKRACKKRLPFMGNHSFRRLFGTNKQGAKPAYITTRREPFRSGDNRHSHSKRKDLALRHSHHATQQPFAATPFAAEGFHSQLSATRHALNHWSGTRGRCHARTYQKHAATSAFQLCAVAETARLCGRNIYPLLATAHTKATTFLTFLAEIAAETALH